MKTYSKIDTLFDRDEKFKVDVSKLRRDVYSDISLWSATEKIDGTNMRIHFDRASGTRTVAGKSHSAQIPPDLLRHCGSLATQEATAVNRIMDERGLSSLTLFGEGYGAKIQKGGGRYRADQAFILFDVQVSDGPFLSEDAVTALSLELMIPRVPVLGMMSLDAIVGLAQEGFPSRISEDPELPAEGIVARTREPLYDNRGERLMFKLKRKDFA